MISLLKIDTGRSRAEPALTQRANEHSHILRGEREEGGTGGRMGEREEGGRRGGWEKEERVGGWV